MKGFNLSKDVMKNTESIGLYHHRLLETFKHTFAKRSLLGDMDFENVAEVNIAEILKFHNKIYLVYSKLTKNLTDKVFIEKLTSLINYSTTFDEEYYSPAWLSNKIGT